jgi:ubiquitin carboxyl-terminal hydrolase 4/11/15
MYEENNSTFAPRTFKSVISKYQPQFAGYGQQDSQEFMSFLVDGLHEDLNRILKKPYTENPDTDANIVNDPEAIRDLGNKFREIHRSRNSSVIMDLFNGFYKNKLVCPSCGKVSITFDPYSLLTLQLPMTSSWEFFFTFIPLNAKPFSMEIDNEKGQTVRSIKEFAASRIPGVDPDRLLVVEIFSHKVYRYLEDRMSVAEANIQPRDEMYIFELESKPTNFPLKKKKAARSMLDFDSKPEEDEVEAEDLQQLVTVLHRAPTTSHSISSNLNLWPTFITLTKEELRNHDEIVRKVMRAIQVQTVAPLIPETLLTADSTPRPDESVEAIDDDSDGNAVKTRSLSSDDFVDVSMPDADEKPDTGPPPNPSPIPDWYETGAPIPEAIKSLFEIRVSPCSDPIPTGFSSIDGNRSYPTLASRIPKVPSPAASLASNNESEESSPEEAAEDMEEIQEADAEAEADADVDADAEAEPEPEPEQEDNPMSFITTEPAIEKPGSGRNNKGRRNRNNRKKNQQQNKFKKEKPSPPKHTFSPDPEDNTDPRLIRPNDVIIIDWNYTEYERLFGGSGRACRDSNNELTLLEDPILEARRKRRTERKKTGAKLRDCFLETIKEEILTEGNAWYCNRCKELRYATKKLDIWTVPDILVIHLKRFASGQRLRDKVEMLIDFPVEGLDLSEFVQLSEDKSLIYDLFAVDNHYGGLGGGHYTAAAKNFIDEQWYDYNGMFVACVFLQ